MSTTERYATIRNWDNIKYSKTAYHFKLFLIFIRSLNPLAICIMKLHFFFILLLICMQNTSICIIQPHVYNCKTSLFQWQKKIKIVINYNTKHHGIYDWIHANFKHIIKNLQDDKTFMEYSRDNNKLYPLRHLLKMRTWGIEWKKIIDKTVE